MNQERHDHHDHNHESDHIQPAQADHHSEPHAEHDSDMHQEKHSHRHTGEDSDSSQHHGSGAHDEHGGHQSHHAHMVADFKKRFWISLIATAPILLLSPMIQVFLGFGDSLQFPGDSWLLFALSSFVFFYGGSPFLRGFLRELRAATPGMMVLISVAITTAYVYSSAVVFGVPGKVFFWEVVTLIDVMLVGHWIEMRSIMGASRALEELARLMPSEAHRISSDGTIHEVPLSELQTGDRVLVKPGEKVPADGEVVEGRSSMDESMLTGESVPVGKEPGNEVIGGSINGEGSVTVVVGNTGEESFLSQVIDLVRNAQESKSRTQDLANRAALWLTAVAIGGGAITMFVWLAIMKVDFVFALERTVTVMVIACPHALGLAVPLVVAVSTSLAAGNGLLIRDRTAFETSRNLKAILFDKTGTLTEGRFGVTDTLVFSGDLDSREILELAAAVEVHSEHPIARGITRSVETPGDVSEFRATPGKGAEGIVDGRLVQVVSPGFLREQNQVPDEPQIDTLMEQGKTVVFVLVEGDLKGAIALADIIRPESREAISTLRKMGVRTLMLTGDNQKVAKWVSDEIGLDDYFAEVLPADKADKVKEIQASGLTVAMTGDGVNDAPALAQADVGIAVGAGTDVAVETADIVLVRSNPMDVLAILKLSRATYRKMVQNLWWAAGYNIVTIPIAAGVLYSAGILISPAMGAVLMSISTVIVAINARLLRL